MFLDVIISDGLLEGEVVFDIPKTGAWSVKGKIGVGVRSDMRN